MRSALRWGVAVVVILHGLIHLLGAAKGLGWADVSALRTPITEVMGVAWLSAGVLVVIAGVLLPLGLRWWWTVGVVAAVSSQLVIATSWSDAKAGTVVNLLLVLAAAVAFAAQGPASYRAEYRRITTALLSPRSPSAVVVEADLDHLPACVARFVRTSGAVGQTHVNNFRAQVHGRIRAGKDKPWMAFTGEQVNTYGPDPARLFFIDATMSGLPMDVLHVYLGAAASMRVRLCSVVTMVRAVGPEMDRSETVTLFNDLCLLAPAALVTAPITWHQIDENHVLGSFTNGTQSVTADLVFDAAGNLVDFVSDDRSRASKDGRSFTRQRWSTPSPMFGNFADRRACTQGVGCWHAPHPVGRYRYLEISVDAISYNATTAGREAGSPASGTPASTSSGRCR